MTSTQARATPANPVPGTTIDKVLLREDERNLPPELGCNAIAVVEGVTFMYSDVVGDIPEASIGGLVNADTRFINKWELRLNGKTFEVLRSGEVDHYSAAFFLTNGKGTKLMPNAVGARRLRFVGDGLHERIELHCFADRAEQVEVRLAVGNDFADLFEIKGGVRDERAITRDHAEDGSRLVFNYRNAEFEATTIVNANPAADRIEGDDLVWDIDLQPGVGWTLDLHVPVKYGDHQVVPRHEGFNEVFDVNGSDPISQWMTHAPSLSCDSEMLQAVIMKSIRDLLALRIQRMLGTHQIVLPAAGLPWFLTLFGRDTLITAFQTVPFGPRLAHGALVALAEMQGTERNDFKDEEPGKILHEVRFGELTQLGIEPHSPYFGTADATQLWLILLSEYWRWTRDDDLVRHLQRNALAALDWIDRYGDRDGDGYVEYATRSAMGLGNQCWRDSWDGIQYADGRIPPLPLATCELQGYTYDAKVRMAELADGPLNDALLARRLRSEAELLRERFNRDFWIKDRRGGYYAVALDGDKNLVDSMTSNMGHLLWSGIVPEDRASILAKHLLGPELFSGWGIRTLSTVDEGYNPIGYHLGTVWPHDNSLVALGLVRYGFRGEANRVAMAMFEAAMHSEARLPEAFSGYSREIARFPVPYPTACSPQAWASGAPIAFLRTMLGMDARNGRIMLDPNIPDEIGRIAINRTEAFGARWDIEAKGRSGYVSLSDYREPSRTRS